MHTVEEEWARGAARRNGKRDREQSISARSWLSSLEEIGAKTRTFGTSLRARKRKLAQFKEKLLFCFHVGNPINCALALVKRDSFVMSAVTRDPTRGPRDPRRKFDSATGRKREDTVNGTLGFDKEGQRLEKRRCSSIHQRGGAQKENASQTTGRKQ